MTVARRCGWSDGQVLLAAFALLACADEVPGRADASPSADAASPPDASPPVDLPRWRPEEDAERLASLTCARYRRCAPSLFPRSGWDDEACVLAVRDLESEALVRRAQLVVDGRATFDRPALERCVAALAGPGCAPVDCPRFFVGVVDDGGACTDSDECATANAYCTGEAAIQCGVCARKRGGLQACAIDVECASGRCAQRCLPPVEDGDLCDKVCTFGLCCPGSCVGFGMGSGVCRRRATLGEPCDQSEREQPGCDTSVGLVCSGGRCAAVETVAVGERCDDARWCADETSCVEGVCRDWPRAGEPCAGRCRGDDLCLHGECRPPPAAGDPCVLDDQCAPHLVCRGAGTRTCGVRVWSACSP